MKDKRNILKLSCILEFIYLAYIIIDCLFFINSNEEKIANIFVALITLIITIMIYKESKKDIKEIKKNKLKIKAGIIWMFIYSVAPGILGFFFFSSISDKKRKPLPVIDDKKVSKKEFIISILVFLSFMFLMFVLPLLPIYKKIPLYFIYILIILIILISNYKTLKNDFTIFIKNIKVYIPYIIRNYFIMLGIMVIVALPIILLNSGKISSNQQIINNLFEKLPLFTFLLTSFYAPFAEESIFRLTLRKIISNKTLFVIISGVLFGVLHLIDKATSFYDFLYVFEYSALGIYLSYTYVKTKNIFVPMSMHFIQNFLASIILLGLY